MLKISRNEIVNKYKEVAEIMKNTILKKSKIYGYNNNVFNDFTIIESFNLSKTENIILTRGILDKMPRIINLLGKKENIKNEPITTTIYEMNCYIILFYCYIIGKKNNDLSSKFMIENFNKFIDDSVNLFIEKNKDYSKGNDDGYKGLGLSESLGLLSIEEGIIGRMLIKISRIINLLNYNNISIIKDEIDDFLVYGILLYIYIYKKNN